ncbi:MAG: nucleoside kinase [Bacteroidales bacterium]|jgi:uridine kinase|nr:nucleoside kinase [Bacteroidales bacterium]
MRHIEVYCENTGAYKRYLLGTTLKEICDDQKIKLAYPILGVYVNNLVQDLNYPIYKPINVRFFDYTDAAGRRIYFRSITFVLYKAMQDLYRQTSVTLENSVPHGYYFSFKQLPVTLDEKFIAVLKKRMQEIIRADLPFITQKIPTKDALALFKEGKLTEKARLFKSLNRLYTIINRLDDSVNYLHGYLAPSTKCLSIFDIDLYQGGVLLRVPNPANPTIVEKKEDHPKLAEIFKEHKEWAKLVQAKNIPDVNMHVEEDHASMLIKIAEALQEKKIAQIADMIHLQSDKIRFVLIAGPSSSGKTTFSKRLAVQLGASGIHPYAISLDDYFINREDTPLDENGNYDFESIEALDLQKFNEDLATLARGEETIIPKFDFKTGCRAPEGTRMKINPSDIVIIEGIHGLNPRLTERIPREMKYLIFISALTQIAIDRQDYISTSDNRLIRRMVRDAKYRDYSALETINRWPSVRIGEEKNIFPFQENANIMFNSALIYELGVLKYDAVPLLNEVPENEPAYNDAQRLLRILSYFKPIGIREIPPTSILREFLTGSSFRY